MRMCLWISKPSSKGVVRQLLLIPIAQPSENSLVLCLTIVYFSCFEKHSSFRTTILAERPAYKFWSWPLIARHLDIGRPLQSIKCTSSGLQSLTWVRISSIRKHNTQVFHTITYWSFIPPQTTELTFPKYYTDGFTRVEAQPVTGDITVHQWVSLDILETL